MKQYEKIGWLDHVTDVVTGEVIQEGTPVSQTNMNHMDDAGRLKTCPAPVAIQHQYFPFWKIICLHFFKLLIWHIYRSLYMSGMVLFRIS